MKRLCLALILLATYVLPANAQWNACAPADYGKNKPICSLTGVNGSCTLIVDRMNPATPPTIYIRRGSVVTLKVINPSPLEQLELDESSINTQNPIDAVQALTPLLTQLGQFVLPLSPAQVPTPPTSQISHVAGDTAYLVAVPTAALGPKSFADIQKEQRDLLDKIKSDTKLDSDTLKKLADALGVVRVVLVPPLDGCNPASKWSVNVAKLSTAASDLTIVQNAVKLLVGDLETPGHAMADDAVTLANIQADINVFGTGLTAAQKKSDDEITALTRALATLKKRLEDEEKKPRPDAKLIKSWKDEIALQQHDIDTKKAGADQAAAAGQMQSEQLKAGQGVLSDALTKAQTFIKTVLFPAEKKLQALATAISSPAPTSGPFPIRDLLSKDKNDQQEVFTLNAVNNLTDAVKIFVASPASDAYSQSLADSIVATAPVKTAVMQATVQYVTQPEMEVTTGILVPFLPYKSYTAVPQSSGSATLIVQETRTYTIIPALDLNLRLGNDKFAGLTRYGWFGTVAVGYNPATTMVEFGVGPSFALKSMVFSLLADIGRDTALANGFTNNQPLPVGATAPATNGVWSVKPSFGFSIRLPFNSGSGH